jgi:hypothetical protein
MPWIILICVGLWYLLGDPSRDVANWFWEENAAPWEQVDAIYYSNRHILAEYEFKEDIGSLDNCRRWVDVVAINHKDPGIRRGDYECGINPKFNNDWGIKLYRKTVR